MEIIEKSVLSTDGKHYLQGKIYLPEGEAKGYFHIVHGMSEHMGRYDKFMGKTAEAGYICFGYDHLGHGKTAAEGELGFIASRNGWKYLCSDVEKFSSAVMAEYGKKPYYLMGHSMGSFIVRLAVTMGAEPDRLIVMGTGGKNPAADAGLTIISIMKKLRGEKYVSKFIDNMAFGSYNKRFKEDDDKAWLTTDVSIRDEYRADPISGYKFTLSAMHDLITLNRDSNADRTFEATPKDMPILLVSGTDDPVGDYGAGVKQVLENYLKAGNKAEMILYDGCRHEILNDICCPKTTKDILGFIS